MGLTGKTDPGLNASSTQTSSQRIAAIDAFRGFVMFLMMAELLHLPDLAKHFPDSEFWKVVGFNTQHVEWSGCSLHDLIQPGFSFLVGVALPFSIASRLVRGQTFPRMFGHAVWRSLLLIALGIFLRSVGKPQTRFTFEDTLTQIGLGYSFLFLLAFRGRLVQLVALAVILVAYWAAFALYPVPDGHVGEFSGFAAHWNKNANLASAFDQWFLNLFPPPGWFGSNPGGYATLSFVPTLGTMILGLIAGGWLQEKGPASRKLVRLIVAGAVCLALGWLLDWSGICPSVKRIWTPAWTLWSGGWCLLLLTGFYVIMEVVGFRIWAFPLVVIGMNSIAIYCLVHLMDRFIVSSLRTHLGREMFQKAGAIYEPLLTGAATLLIFWLILFWMYRRKLFLKI